MEPVSILIVEDVLLIAEEIRVGLEKSGYEICGVLTKGEELMPFLHANYPDLVIMDIRLAGKMDGIEAASLMREQYPIPVIFLTDIDNEKTLVRAGRVCPAAYLFKPFNNRQLHASISTAFYNASHGRPAALTETMGAQEQSHIMAGYIYIKDKNGFFEKIDVSHIVAMHADRVYCDLYLKDGRKAPQSMNMGALNKKIASPSMVQVHRSWMVNVKEVERIKGNTLVIGELEIPVSKDRLEEVLALFTIIR